MREGSFGFVSVGGFVDGSGMSSYRRRPRGFVLDPSKGMLPLLGLQVLLEYGRAGSARPPTTAPCRRKPTSP